MSDSRFHPGVLVRDNWGKVGKVVSEPDSRTISGETHLVVPVDFWGKEEPKRVETLTLLHPNSPEALLWESPEKLAPWADDAPLRLTALALSVDGGRGKAAHIRAKLDGRVIEEGRWKNWWGKRSKALGSLPGNFRVAKVKGGNEYALISPIDSVPADWTPPSKPKPVKLADWRKWLQSGAPAPSPGRFPTKQVANSYSNWSSKWSGKAINDALFGLIARTEEIGIDGGMNAQTAEGWLSTIAQAAIRWQESGQGDTAGYAAARVGGVMAQLAKLAAERTPQELLLQTAALDGKVDAWRRGFLAGMWETFNDEDARDLYMESHGVLGRQARGDLARQIALAAFGPEMSDRRHSELDRLLDALPESDRLHILKEVIARATTGQRGAVLDYIASSRHASSDERLPLRIVAVLMLSEGQGKLAARTSWELAESLASPDAYGPEVPALYENTAARVQAIMAYNAGNFEELKEAHEVALEHEQREKEYWRQQVRERNAELAANREESRLEILQDMLLASGELLQAAGRWATLEEAVSVVEAGLTLAIRSGGADLLETTGSTVDYNPLKHSSDIALPDRCRVKVIAPGVIYHGGIHGHRVMLKAQVRQEAG